MFRQHRNSTKVRMRNSSSSSASPAARLQEQPGGPGRVMMPGVRCWSPPSWTHGAKGKQSADRISCLSNTSTTVTSDSWPRSQQTTTPTTQSQITDTETPFMSPFCFPILRNLQIRTWLPWFDWFAFWDCPWFLLPGFNSCVSYQKQCGFYFLGKGPYDHKFPSYIVKVDALSYRQISFTSQGPGRPWLSHIRGQTFTVPLSKWNIRKAAAQELTG